MSEDRWAELLRSPLDPDPAGEQRERPRRRLSWRLVVVVLVAGAFAGGAFAVWQADEVTAAPETTTSAAPTSTTPPPALPTYPDGYVEAIDGIGISAVGWYRNQGSLFVVVSAAVRSDQDPVETAALRDGSWALVEDGGIVEYSRQVWDQPALGVSVVEFDDVAEIPGTLRFAAVVDQHTETITLPALDGYPIEGAGPFSFTLEHDLDFVVDSVTAGEAWGNIEWHIAGGSDEAARASIGSVAILTGTDDPGTPDEVDPTLLVSPHLAPPYPFQLHPPPAPGFGFRGADQLQRVGEPLGQDNWPTTVEIEVTVSMIFPGEGDSAIVEISLEGLPELS
jgi:hypothetical protein